MIVRPLVPTLTLALTCALSAFFGRPPGLGAQLPTTVVDSASAELDRGRAWHATRILLEHPLGEFTPDERLLLARAEAGWRNPRGVADALRGQAWLSELDDGAGLYLLGLAEAELGDAEEGVRLLELYQDLTPEADARAITRSRLARIQARAGAFDAAIAVLESMREDRVELRAWTALAVARTAARVLPLA